MNDLNKIRLGFGTWAWGDRLVWSFSRDYDDQHLREAFAASLDSGIHFFDTAEVYGQGKSERLLGQFQKEFNTEIQIATKFMPFPWRLGKSGLRKALNRSLERLRTDQVFLYQMHMPLAPFSVQYWMDQMAEVYHAGMVKHIGVANLNAGQVKLAYEQLRKRDVPLAAHQIEYNLLVNNPETEDVINLCNDLKIRLIAYSPLAMGILTGKYTPESPPPGVRGMRFNRRRLAEIQPLIEALRRVGMAHDGKTPAQVALNWTITKGFLPIPGVKTQTQVLVNCGALDWQMTDNELNTLDTVTTALNQGDNQ
jgi:aryl-alcohol dehydrogenase-like predicted oxidoreductase